MKNVFSAKATLLVACTMLSPLAIPTTAMADIFGASETRQWNVCDWERLPESVVSRISNRSDYDDILRRMFEVCPDSALGLTDRPTASISSGSTASSDEAGDKSDGGSEGRGGRSTSRGSNTESADTSFGLPG